MLRARLTALKIDCKMQSWGISLSWIRKISSGWTKLVENALGKTDGEQVNSDSNTFVDVQVGHAVAALVRTEHPSQTMRGAPNMLTRPFRPTKPRTTITKFSQVCDAKRVVFWNPESWKLYCLQRCRLRGCCIKGCCIRKICIWKIRTSTWKSIHD